MSTGEELRLRAGSLELAALAWGPTNAQPLLALHGWLDNAASFAALAPRLAGHFRVIALDLPGHGHSAHLSADAYYHFPDYVRAVLAAAEALGLARFTLLGHSMGAGVAALLAATAPQRVASLHLIEGLGPLGDDGSRTLQRFREAVAPEQRGNRSLRLFRDVDQAASARAIASGLHAALARPIVERGLRQTDGGWQWRSDPRLTRPSAVRLAESQVRALLAGITAPTALLLSRPATPYLPALMMRERAACVPCITVDHMDGCHHLQLEHPEKVATWLLRHAAGTGP